MDRVVELPFRVVAAISFPNTATSTITEYDLVLSNLGARAVAVGSTFEFFRFKKLSAYQYTDIVGPVWDTVTPGVQGHLSADHYLVFIESNAALTGTPTTLTQLAQYELFKAGSVFQRLRIQVPVDTLRANNLKWYNTASTGASTDSLSPGIFVQGANNQRSTISGWTGACRCVIEGVIQFRGMITPALSFDTIKDHTNLSVASADDFVVASHTGKSEAKR